MNLNPEKCRFTLGRVWDEDEPTCLFVMLNSSTADEKNDDQTIRKCKRIAEVNNFGSFRVVNLFAFRATNPAGLNLADNPIGSGNDEIILKEAKKRKKKGEKIIVAWGDGERVEEFKKRSKEILDLFKKEDIEVCCLGITASGNPCHPLNVSCQSPFPLKSFPISNF
ncbi:DUF1643 domain-containing protein [Patescibacteria group bacterium]|nr:DUF1643 domain-containing protein [Patescibacteria group bacterium]